MMEYLLLWGFNRFFRLDFLFKKLCKFVLNTLAKVFKNCIIPLKKFVAKQSNKSGYERFQNSK